MDSKRLHWLVRANNRPMLPSARPAVQFLDSRLQNWTE